jgi:RNA polymerase sigma-70 factor (ECF subfamily)
VPADAPLAPATTGPATTAAATPPGPTDGELLARVARGEYAAFTPLYDRHQEAVARFVARATRRSPDVEDIVQETFLCAARKAASFDGRASCRPWLLGIAARHILHARRTLTRFRGFLERHRRLEILPPAPDPQQDAEKQQEYRRLEQSIAGLSEAKRVVLLLTEIEDMTCEQVAAALDIPIGTVWTRLHHARRELREALNQAEKP